VRSWNRERAKAEQYHSEADEIYADIILSWLKRNVHTVATLNSSELARSLGLAEPLVSRGLSYLQTRLNAVKQVPGGWLFSAIGAASLEPKCQKLFPSSIPRSAG